MPASCARDSTSGSRLPKERPTPAAWKMNMLVLLMLYPVVFVFGALVQNPLLVGHGMPFWLALFIGNVVSVTLLNWLVPWSARRFGWWITPQGASVTRINIIGAGSRGRTLYRVSARVCLVFELAIGALEHFPMTFTSPGRHGRAWPGHPRLDRAKDVDARPMPGMTV